MAAGIHLNDIGTVFEATIKKEDGKPASLVGYTQLLMKFNKPGCVTIERPAILVNDGLDGKIMYKSVDGDLDKIGPWKVQGKVTLPSGSWSSDLYEFEVHANL